MAENPRPPVAIRIVRPYPTEDEFLEAELETVGKTSVILIGAHPRPTGVILRFEVTLASGTTLLRGEGRVLAHKENAFRGQPGLALRFTRLDPRSKALVDRAAAMREAKLGGASTSVPSMPAQSAAQPAPPSQESLPSLPESLPSLPESVPSFPQAPPAPPHAPHAPELTRGSSRPRGAPARADRALAEALTAETPPPSRASRPPRRGSMPPPAEAPPSAQETSGDENAPTYVETRSGPPAALGAPPPEAPPEPIAVAPVPHTAPSDETAHLEATHAEAMPSEILRAGAAHVEAAHAEPEEPEAPPAPAPEPIAASQETSAEFSANEVPTRNGAERSMPPPSPPASPSPPSPPAHEAHAKPLEAPSNRDDLLARLRERAASLPQEKVAAILTPRS